MVRLDALRFAYPGREVLSIDSLHVAAGASLLLTGTSGSGKTTLLHLMAGLLLSTSGRVFIDGRDLASLPPADRDRFRGRTIGMVLQQFHLLGTLTAIENVLIAQHSAGLPVDAAHARSMLASLGVAECEGALPHRLSVGQQQRVAIARALVNGPRLVLADEPTSNLDDEACAAVADLLLESTVARGVTLVVATHDSRLKNRFDTVLALSQPSPGGVR